MEAHIGSIGRKKFQYIRLFKTKVEDGMAHDKYATQTQGLEAQINFNILNYIKLLCKEDRQLLEIEFKQQQQQQNKLLYTPNNSDEPTPTTIFGCSDVMLPLTPAGFALVQSVLQIVQWDQCVPLHSAMCWPLGLKPNQLPEDGLQFDHIVAWNNNFLNQFLTPKATTFSSPFSLKSEDKRQSYKDSELFIRIDELLDFNSTADKLAQLAISTKSTDTILNNVVIQQRQQRVDHVIPRSSVG